MKYYLFLFSVLSIINIVPISESIDIVVSKFITLEYSNILPPIKLPNIPPSVSAIPKKVCPLTTSSFSSISEV